MSSDKNLQIKPNPNLITIHAKKDESELDAIAKAAIKPTIQAAKTLALYDTEIFGELNLDSMVSMLSAESKAVIGGDLGRGESMLTAQAHTLDGIFNLLARRAHANLGHNIEIVDRYMRLALKAQSQCRTTWEAISMIKNPPIAGYVRQANIAHGPQQVNNGNDDKEPRARENQTQQNKLLEQNDGERLDLRAPGKASSQNPAVEAVGKIHGAKNTRRKSKSRS